MHVFWTINSFVMVVFNMHCFELIWINHLLFYHLSNEEIRCFQKSLESFIFNNIQINNGHLFIIFPFKTFEFREFKCYFFKQFSDFLRQFSHYLVSFGSCLCCQSKHRNCDMEKVRIISPQHFLLLLQECFSHYILLVLANDLPSFMRYHRKT